LHAAWVNVGPTSEQRQHQLLVTTDSRDAPTVINHDNASLPSSSRANCDIVATPAVLRSGNKCARNGGRLLDGRSLCTAPTGVTLKCIPHENPTGER